LLGGEIEPIGFRGLLQTIDNIFRIYLMPLSSSADKKKLKKVRGAGVIAAGVV
jgi:hypothetical protein